MSTKIIKEDYEKLEEMCNHDGQCISESLRDMIRSYLDAYEESLELEKEEKTTSTHPQITIKNTPDTPMTITHGEVLDDQGNVLGTF